MSVTLSTDRQTKREAPGGRQPLLDFADKDRKQAESGHVRPHKNLAPCCAQCGSPTVDYRHSLSKGLADVLIRIYRHRSPVRARELGLNYSQASNLQKLRYWNLIEHVTIEDKRTGQWSITETGEQFVRAAIRLPRHAWSYRAEALNEFEGEMVLITDLIPGYNWRVTYAEEARPHVAA
jgi:hypothetical protein